ncbi:MAG: universal stress protein [Flavobacteriales bacterium]|nr:universal stress protein [Flavobacteriales bacterium]
MKKILVPTDFSAPASNALEAAVQLAKKHGASMHLLHAVDVPSTWQDGQFSTAMLATKPTKVQHDLYPEARERVGAARQQLEATTMALQKRGVKSAYTLAPNAAWKEVVDATSKLSADLVVMGTHGAGALKEAFLGSHAQRVIRHCNAPVLTIRHKWAGRAERVALLADPMEKGTEKHLNRLMAMLEGPRTRFHLVRVNTPGRFQDTRTSFAQLEALAKKLTSAVNLHVVDHFSPHEGGIDFAVGESMDMIALITHGRTGANSFLNPSIAETIANQSPLPTLTLRVGA